MRPSRPADANSQNRTGAPGDVTSGRAGPSPHAGADTVRLPSAPADRAAGLVAAREPRVLSVLVLPRDPTLGGLIATLVELAGHRPVVACPEDQPATLVARDRYDVAMVDCDHPAASSRGFVAAARARGTEVLLFTGTRSESDTRSLAAARGVRWFALPNGPRRLAQALAATAGGVLG